MMHVHLAVLLHPTLSGRSSRSCSGIRSLHDPSTVPFTCWNLDNRVKYCKAAWAGSYTERRLSYLWISSTFLLHDAVHPNWVTFTIIMYGRSSFVCTLNTILRSSSFWELFYQFHNDSFSRRAVWSTMLRGSMSAAYLPMWNGFTLDLPAGVCSDRSWNHVTKDLPSIDIMPILLQHLTCQSPKVFLSISKRLA